MLQVLWTNLDKKIITFFKTPLPQNLKLSKNMSLPLVDPQLYQRMVNKLVFLMNTKWEVAFVINLVFLFMSHPQVVHM